MCTLRLYPFRNLKNVLFAKEINKERPALSRNRGPFLGRHCNVGGQNATPLETRSGIKTQQESRPIGGAGRNATSPMQERLTPKKPAGPSHVFFLSANTLLI